METFLAGVSDSVGEIVSSEIQKNEKNKSWTNSSNRVTLTLYLIVTAATTESDIIAFCSRSSAVLQAQFLVHAKLFEQNKSRSKKDQIQWI